MILHLLSLMRWEWFKLRHRWFPWVLLVIFTLFTQMLVWIGYLVYRGEGEVGAAELFLLPGSVTLGLRSMFGLAIVLIVTLSASMMGTEYGWGTLRTALARGPGRWQLLVAKFGISSLAGLGGLIIAAVFIGISSLVTTGLAENSSGIDVVRRVAGSYFDNCQSGFYVDTVRTLGRSPDYIDVFRDCRTGNNCGLPHSGADSPFLSLRCS